MPGSSKILVTLFFFRHFFCMIFFTLNFCFACLLLLSKKVNKLLCNILVTSSSKNNQKQNYENGMKSSLETNFSQSAKPFCFPFFSALYYHKWYWTTKSSSTFVNSTGAPTCQLLSIRFRQNFRYFCFETTESDRRESDAWGSTSNSRHFQVFGTFVLWKTPFQSYHRCSKNLAPVRG